MVYNLNNRCNIIYNYLLKILYRYFTLLTVWHDSILQFAEGVQQGDLILFCLSVHNLSSQLRSEFNVWYLDDASVGGVLKNISHDLEIVQGVGSELGLHLNHQKSKVRSTPALQQLVNSVSYPRCPGIGPSKCHFAGLPPLEMSPLSHLSSMTRSAISPWVKDFSIYPRIMPFSSVTHLPSDHHSTSSPSVSTDMMRPSDPLSATSPTSI